MGLAKRKLLYERIEAHRDRPLIVYVTSKRQGVYASMATDALPSIIDQLQALPADAESVDILIASLGGDPMVAWRNMSLLRERVKNVAVLIPQSAFSAATLLALGANEIVVHPNGHLGPVDMQVSTFGEQGPTRFSTEDIGAFIEFVREQLLITDQEHLRRLFEALCKEVGTLGVGFTARSSQLALSLGEKMLEMHLDDDESGTRRRNLIEQLSRKFHAHEYPVSRSEAINMGLPVNKDHDTQLEGLMWDVWLDVEEELKERTPFHPISEILNSPEGAKLLAPVPQWLLPTNAPGPNYFSLDSKDVDKFLKEKIEPVDFENVESVLESIRVASRSVTTGKILASRTPDLDLEWNVYVTRRGWQSLGEQGAKNEA